MNNNIMNVDNLNNSASSSAHIEQQNRKRASKEARNRMIYSKVDSGKCKVREGVTPKEVSRDRKLEQPRQVDHKPSKPKMTDKQRQGLHYKKYMKRKSRALKARADESAAEVQQKLSFRECHTELSPSRHSVSEADSDDTNSTITNDTPEMDSIELSSDSQETSTLEANDTICREIYFSMKDKRTNVRFPSGYRNPDFTLSSVTGHGNMRGSRGELKLLSDNTPVQKFINTIGRFSCKATKCLTLGIVQPDERQWMHGELAWDCYLARRMEYTHSMRCDISVSLHTYLSETKHSSVVEAGTANQLMRFCTQLRQDEMTSGDRLSNVYWEGITEAILENTVLRFTQELAHKDWRFAQAIKTSALESNRLFIGSGPADEWVHDYGLVYPVEATVDKPYTNNQQFLDMSTGTYFTGDLGFTYKHEAKRFQPAYIHGPAFVHSGVVYENSMHNTQLAQCRLTNCKDDGIDAFAYHQRLRLNQRNFNDSILVETYMKVMQNRLIEALHSHQECTVIADISRWAQESDQKRAMRVRIASDIRKGLESTEISKHERKAQGKLKFEIAKPGKYSRLFISLGLKAVTVCGHAIKYFKSCMAKPYITNKLHLEFIATPRLDKLREAFMHCLAPTKQLVVYVFSDDMMFSCRTSTGVQFGEADISSCDGSITEAIFHKLIQWSTVDSYTHQAMKLAVDQVYWPVSIANPNNRKQRVKLKPLQPCLYSGTSITTLADTWGSSTIALAWLAKIDELHNSSDLSGTMQRIAEDAGFKITCDVRHQPEELTFLKHSPAFNTNGDLEAVLNLGVVLRSFGRKKSNFSAARTGVAAAARNLNSGIVAGLKHAGNHPVMEQFRRFYPPNNAPRYFNYMLSYIEGQQLGTCTLEAITKRYSMPVEEQELMMTHLRTMRPCHVLRSKWVDRILAFDYGYTPPSSKALPVRLDMHPLVEKNIEREIKVLEALKGKDRLF
jgi:hypothetical protein